MELNALLNCQHLYTITVFRHHPLLSKYFNLSVLLFCSVSASTQSNYLNAANAALKRGDFQSTHELLEKAEAHCKETEKVKQNSAVLSAMEGDTDVAIQTLNKIINNGTDNPSLYYNRAIILLNQNDYSAALDDFKKASSLGGKKGSQSERHAFSLKHKSETKQVEALCKLAEQATNKGSFDLAHLYYEDALRLRPNETQVLFSQAHTGLIQGNPFISLNALEKIKPATVANDEQLEITLVKAYSLARINKMPEAIRLLENALYSDASDDMRIRELLSYYYLKLSKHQKTLDVLSGRASTHANTFVIAGNAALRLKKYKHALFCYKQAKTMDDDNLNAALGIAMCYSSTDRNQESISYIDSLSQSHPDNHLVWNVNGIIHKDVGLYYKNNFRENQAKAFFVKSAAAFLMAQGLNKHMQAVYNSNRALALYFQNQKEAAKIIWSENDELSSQNNLALLLASQRDYSAAYQILDDQYDDFWTKTKKKHHIIDYNRGLARSRTTLNNNYKFLTNFKLNQERPTLVVENLFSLKSVQDIEAADSFEYILATSDEDCKEQINRRKVKKKKKKKWKFKFFKRKKKKYNGGCPKF